jgi:Ca-activated chloride channel family protein
MLLLLLLLAATGANARTITVKGKVTDADSKKAIAACKVSVAGNRLGTTADGNGVYSISVSEGDTLVFACEGYFTEKIAANRKTIDVALMPEAEVLIARLRLQNETLDETLNTPEMADRTERTMEMRMESDESRPVALKLSRPAASRSVGSIIAYGARANTEEYGAKKENRFRFASEEPLSTFSIDVDAASYANVRRFVNEGQMPPKNAVRAEEMINYFSYDYAAPDGKDPVRISAETDECPWNRRHRLVRVGLKAREIPSAKLPPSNFVFLIDVSGSMSGPGRLGLVKSSLKLLTNNLREADRVAIVVYAGSAGEVLPSTSGGDKQKIREALDKLEAGGSTAGGAGIALAYRTARQNFMKEGNNRVILCTDGDFNVGISSVAELESLIESERRSGVFLTVLGYGMGNYKDSRMQALAEKGNGNHAYIDNLQEANKVLVSEFGGTMHAVAKDVKLQIEFNPEHVQAYRLVGYESRLLNNEDFNDDTKDAGEMGAGHCVTAFYEIVPPGVEFAGAGKVDPLKYQKPKKESTGKPQYSGSKEMLTIKLRYKQPDGNASEKTELPVIDEKTNAVSSDFRFAAAVAMLAQLLSDSEFKADATYDKVIDLAKTALNNDERGYRREFVRLAETVGQL